MEITRRNLIKSLVLIPFIDWNKPVRFKLELEIPKQRVSHTFYTYMHPAQKRFYDSFMDDSVKYIFIK